MEKHSISYFLGKDFDYLADIIDIIIKNCQHGFSLFFITNLQAFTKF
jgi:hypothetical protein